MELFILLAFAGSAAFLLQEILDDEDEDETEAAGTELTEELEAPGLPPEEPAGPDADLELRGSAGTTDALSGGDGSDTLSGNRGDRDLLDGGSGEDDLPLGAGNSANGGAGADLFTLSDEGSPETMIEDFELGIDRLALTGGADGYVELIKTEDGNGLRLLDTLSNRTIVTLPGVSLAEGEALEVDILDGNGDHYRTVRFDDPGGSAPFALDAMRGTSEGDILTGTESDDVVFGEGGADTLTGGDGDDTLFSGSGTRFYHHS